METKERNVIKNIKEIDMDLIKFFEINGDIYIEIQAEENKKELLRYNEKFDKLVSIQFIEDSNINTEDKIIETLSSQYIESMIYRG